MIKLNVLNLSACLFILIGLTGCGTTGDASTGREDAVPDLFLVSVEAQRAYRESRWLDAARLYQTLVEHLPSDASAWFHLANTYARQGAFDSAIHAYKQSVHYDSVQPKVWFNLSSVYLLNAQLAMRKSSAMMHNSDPAQAMITSNLLVLDELINEPAQ